MNTILKKVLLFHWNIGFVNKNIDSMIQDRDIYPINWLNHKYRDRFFADPFILNVSENYIDVLVEEFFYNQWKGVITFLRIDSKKFTIKERKIILELDTHLSYPFIFKENDNTYILPENANNNKLTIYKYNEKERKIESSKCLIHEPAIDPTIYKKDNIYYLFYTIKGRGENKNLFILFSKNIEGPYEYVSKYPLISDISTARPGGWIGNLENGNLIRVSQNSSLSYGESLNINLVEELSPSSYKEINILKISPDKRYKNGIHTLDMKDDICVIDGLTYIFNPITKIRKIFIKR